MKNIHPMIDALQTGTIGILIVAIYFQYRINQHHTAGIRTLLGTTNLAFSIACAALTRGPLNRFTVVP